MTDTPKPERLTPQQIAGKALARLRKRADLKQEQAAELAGVTVGSWRRYEWGERNLSLDDLQRFAELLGFTLDDYLEERERVRKGLPPANAPGASAQIVSLNSRREIAAPSLQLIPIRDAVKAGLWEEVDDVDQSPPRMSSTVRDPRYAHAEQWLAPVKGDSVNKLGIFDGDLVHVVDAIAIGYEPVTGHLVEVERVRREGSERELTLKEVEVTSGGIKLWPRSTNAKWQAPINIGEGVPADEDYEVRIRGVVIASIRRFSQDN